LTAEGRGDGLELEARTRETTLERLKKSLAERSAPAPQVEGYPLWKARKILELMGVGAERVRLKLVEHDAERGRVVHQRPRPAEPLDLEDADQAVELSVAEQSIIGFLPQIYQRSDLTGRNFVRDLLWVIQHLQFQTDEKLLGLERFFDPHECPADFLPYLASWVALDLEDGWPELKKRSLIKKAVELYHLRGTPRGLRVYLRIFTGVDPVIHENLWPFDGLVVGVSSTVGVDSVLMHHVRRDHAFVVHIPLPIDQVDDDTIRKIHRIIELERPVHTDYYLTFAAPEEADPSSAFVVGVSSTVGVDTWVDGEAYLAGADEEEDGMEPSAPGDAEEEGRRET